MASCAGNGRPKAARYSRACVRAWLDSVRLRLRGWVRRRVAGVRACMEALGMAAGHGRCTW